MRVPHGGSVLRGRQWWAHVYLQRASSFLLFFLLPWWMNAEPSSWRRDLCILLGCPSFGRPAAEGPFSDSCWRREDLLPRVFFSSCVRGRFLPWQKVPCNLKPQFWPLLIQSQHGTKKKLWGECLHHQLGELMVWIQQPIFSPTTSHCEQYWSSSLDVMCCIPQRLWWLKADTHMALHPMGFAM